MASGGRKAGSDGGRMLIDWEAAFSFFASQPPERRSYAAVAAEFGVSVRTVEAHGRRDGWRERMRSIEQEASLQADRELARARADQLADFRRLIEASCVAYARQLASGQVRVTASDLVGLIRVSLLLEGDASGRVELTASSPEWTALRSRILAALAPHPEAQQALLQALSEAAE